MCIIFRNGRAREYDVLSECLGRPKQICHVRGVSSYQGWKYGWPQHASMYRKSNRTKTDASINMKKLKEQIKQEPVVEMQMQNNLLKRLCCHHVVLSPVSNHTSPSPATLKSSCASADNIGLIDGTAELTITSTVLNINDQTIWSRYMQIWSQNTFL
jgi:hypothetical protein